MCDVGRNRLNLGGNIGIIKDFGKVIGLYRIVLKGGKN